MVTRMAMALYTAKGVYRAKGLYHDKVTRICAFWEEASTQRRL